MGSGTTAIAALKAHRDYERYEINAQHVKLANKRLAFL